MDQPTIRSFVAPIGIAGWSLRCQHLFTDFRSMARPLHICSRRSNGPVGATSLEHSGPEQTRGPVRRRGTTARERNRLSEQKLARSAHLPQKLANLAVSARLGRTLGTPLHGWNPGSPIFFGVAKLNMCIESIHIFGGSMSVVAAVAKCSRGKIFSTRWIDHEGTEDTKIALTTESTRIDGI